MKANIKILKKRRIYSEEFKRELVKDFESGQFSVPQLEKLHGISNPTIYRWIHKFSTFNEKGSRVVEMKNSSANKMKEQQARIKELEAIVGRKQIKENSIPEFYENFYIDTMGYFGITKSDLKASNFENTVLTFQNS